MPASLSTKPLPPSRHTQRWDYLVPPTDEKRSRGQVCDQVSFAPVFDGFGLRTERGIPPVWCFSAFKDPDCEMHYKLDRFFIFLSFFFGGWCVLLVCLA